MAILVRTPLTPQHGPRELAVLRLLGRMQVLGSDDIARLIYPDRDVRTARRGLQALLLQKLIWQRTAVTPRIDQETGRGAPPLRAPWLYGLSSAGKQILRAREAEATPAILEHLYVREARPGNAYDATLGRTLAAARWVASVIDGARRMPTLDAIECSIGAQLHNKHHCDALLNLRFNHQARPQHQPGWQLPWYDGSATHNQQVVLRFALELDDGAETVDAIVRRVLSYQQLHQQGASQRTRDQPRPVLIVPSEVRAKEIALRCHAAWPDGPGLIAVEQRSLHAEYGALWGRTATLHTAKPQSMPLLAPMINTLEAWVAAVAGWVPGAPTS